MLFLRKQRRPISQTETLGETFLGYGEGKEKFQRPNGTWVVDDLKTSYYAYIPDSAKNKWPSEINLKEPYENSRTAHGNYWRASYVQDWPFRKLYRF